MYSNDEKKNDEISILAKEGIIALAGKIIGRGSNIVAHVIIARLLGPDDFGLFAIGWSFANILGVSGSFGMHHAVIRFSGGASNLQEAKDVLYKIMGWALALALLWGVGLYATSARLESIFNKVGLAEILQGFSFSVFMMVLLQVASAGTRASRKMVFSAIGEDITQPALLLSFVIFFIANDVELIGKNAVNLITLSYCGALLLILFSQSFPVFQKLFD